MHRLMRRLHHGRGSQWLVAIVVVALVTTGGVAAAVTVTRHVAPETRSVCAMFSDAVGLYEDNKVSLLGIEIGRITSIENVDGAVRITMSIDRGIKLPADVGAATISNSIVNDRRVEFTKAYNGGPELDYDTCLPLERTRTPRSVSELFASVEDLTSALTKNGNSKMLSELLAKVDTATTGTVDEIRGIVGDLATLAQDPKDLNSDIRALIDSIDTIAQEANGNYDEITEIVHRLDGVVWLVDHWADEFAQGIDYGKELLPVIERNLDKYNDEIMNLLNLTTPLFKGVADYIGPIEELLATSPVMIDSLLSVLDSSSGAIRVDVLPPAQQSEGGR